MGTLMRISRIFEAKTWLRAVGEVVLIVLGVTIALAAGSWYEGQRERLEERLALRELVQSLEVDLDELHSRYEIQVEVRQNVQALLDHLEADAPYSPELEPYFGAVRILPNYEESLEMIAGLLRDIEGELVE